MNQPANTFSPTLPVRQGFRFRHPLLFWLTMLVLLVAGLTLLALGLSAAEERGLFSPKRLAVVAVEGTIMESDELVAWIERLRRDRSVAGVLVRINSPGGGVTPSQEIHRALERLRESGRPMVASMSTVAASGGYYVAVAAQEIYAAPSTLTGSIGVKLQTPDLSGLLDRVGIREQTLTTGALKDAGSPYRPMTGEERAYLVTLIEDMQEEFVATVARGRKMEPEAVRAVADGRALTGRQALAAGLVDALGDRHDALARLAQLAGMSTMPEKVLTRPAKEEPMWKKMISSLLEISGSALPSPQYGFYYL